MTNIKELLGWRKELCQFQDKAVRVTFSLSHESWAALLERELLVGGNCVYGVSSDSVEDAAMFLLEKLKAGPIRLSRNEYLMWDPKFGVWAEYSSLTEAITSQSIKYMKEKG